MQRGSRGMNVNYLKPRFLRFRLRMLPNEERAKAFEIEHFLLSFGPVVRWGARYRRIDYGFALDGNVVFHYALSPERRKYMTRTAHPFGSENIIGFTSCSEEVMRSILGDRRMRTFWPMRGEGACILGPEDPLQVIEIEESPWAPAGVRAAPPIPPAIAPSIAPAPAPAIDPASTPASALAYPAATVNAAPAADLVAAFVAAIAAVSVAGPAALASALQSALGASAAQLASSLPASAPALPSASAVPSAGGASAGDAPPIDVYEIPASVKAVDGISAALSSSALSMVKQPSSSKAEANAQPPTPSASAFAAVASPGPSRTPRSQRRSPARQASAAAAVGVASRPTRSRSAAASRKAAAAPESTENNQLDSAGGLPSDATTCENPGSTRTLRSQRRSATRQENAAAAVGVASLPNRSRSATASRDVAAAREPSANNLLPESAADLPSDAATCESPGPMRTPRAQRRSAARRTQAAAAAGIAGAAEAGPVRDRRQTDEESGDNHARPVGDRPVSPVAPMLAPGPPEAAPVAAVAHALPVVAPEAPQVAPHAPDAPQGDVPFLRDVRNVVLPKPAPQTSDPLLAVPYSLLTRGKRVVVAAAGAAPSRDEVPLRVADALAEADHLWPGIAAAAAEASIWLGENRERARVGRYHKALELAAPIMEGERTSPIRTNLARLCVETERWKNVPDAQGPSRAAVAAVIEVGNVAKRYNYVEQSAADKRLVQINHAANFGHWEVAKVISTLGPTPPSSPESPQQQPFRGVRAAAAGARRNLNL